MRAMSSAVHTIQFLTHKKKSISPLKDPLLQFQAFWFKSQDLHALHLDLVVDQSKVHFVAIWIAVMYNIVSQTAL